MIKSEMKITRALKEFFDDMKWLGFGKVFNVQFDEEVPTMSVEVNQAQRRFAEEVLDGASFFEEIVVHQGFPNVGYYRVTTPNGYSAKRKRKFN